MKIKLGTDIVAKNRIAGIMQRQPEFANRVLHPQELIIFNAMQDGTAEKTSHNASTDHQQKPVLTTAVSYLSKRWAAKEAAAKALGRGIADGISFHDFIISNDEWGAPRLALHGKAAERALALGVSQFELSISDEKDYAVATVILY